MDSNTPLWQLTVGEFKQLTRDIITSFNEKKEQDIVIGNSELARRLGLACGTVQNYKRNGYLEGTYKQMGRKVIYDFEKVTEVIKKM